MHRCRSVSGKSLPQEKKTSFISVRKKPQKSSVFYTPDVCVRSRPTPKITWTKDGEDLVVQRPAQAKNFNKMIQIPKASFEDAGEYVCTASNKLDYIQHTITVHVKGETAGSTEAFPARVESWKRLTSLRLTAAPFWLEKPADLVLAPEENGRLVCRSDGAPRPTVAWFINGEPIDRERWQTA